MKRLLVIFLLTTLSITACGNNAVEQSEEPVYNMEPVQMNTAEKNHQEMVENKEETSVNNEGEGAQEKDYRIGDKLFADFNGVGEVTDGDKNESWFVNETDFSIVTSGEDGTIYYVNYGTYEDNYIYSYKDGKRELLVEDICNFVNYYDNALYYTVMEEKPEAWPFMVGGKLYRYDLSTNTSELFLDMDVYNLHVKNDILYFKDMKRIEGEQLAGREWYSMNIITKEISKMGKMLPFFYGDYQLAFSQEGDGLSCLELLKGDERIKVTNEYYFFDLWFTISNGSLWISTTTLDGIQSLTEINLADGTHSEYIGTERMNMYCDYIMLNGEIYAQSNHALFRYYDDKGMFDKTYDILGTNCSGVFTDGKYMYVLRFDGQPYLEHTNTIERVNVEKNMEVEIISR